VGGGRETQRPRGVDSIPKVRPRDDHSRCEKERGSPKNYFTINGEKRPKKRCEQSQRDKKGRGRGATSYSFRKKREKKKRVKTITSGEWQKNSKRE